MSQTKRTDHEKDRRIVGKYVDGAAHGQLIICKDSRAAVCKCKNGKMYRWPFYASRSGQKEGGPIVSKYVGGTVYY